MAVQDQKSAESHIFDRTFVRIFRGEPGSERQAAANRVK